MDGNKTIRKPGFKFSLILFLSILLILSLGMLLFKFDSHALLLIVTTISVIAALYLRYSFEEVINFMVEGLSRAMPALFVFIMVGALIAMWIASGTVPALIVYGLKLLSPGVILPVGLILCSIMSVACGTSWGTVGTLGVALMGIGTSMGMPPALVAGAVISGSYFGDKMSPLSDTTNLAAASAGCDVYAHVRSMLKSTVPTYVICLILYSVIGLKYASHSADSIQAMEITNELSSLFNINPITLIPIIVTLILSFMRKPALVAMMVGIVLGGVVAVFYQGVEFADVLSILNYGYSGETEVEAVSTLINRGGIQSMMWTLSFALIILAMGGILEGTGVLSAIVEQIVKIVKRPVTLMLATIGFADFACFATGDSYPALVLTGTVFRPAYDKANMDRSMLSRACEEGASLMIPLVPWSGTAAFMGGALGVTALEYLPFAFLNILNPIVSLILVGFGLTIIRPEKDEDKKEKELSE